MRRRLILLFLPALLAAQSISTNPDVLGAERVFETWMRAQVAYRELPGVAVGVVSDQKLIWAKGFGFADIDTKLSMTPATKFRMASHSKLFTSTAIMQLRDQGKVRLDDPPITIEELLTHCSGLSREAGSHWSDYKFPDTAEVRAYIESSQAIYSPQVRWKFQTWR